MIFFWVGTRPREEKKKLNKKHIAHGMCLIVESIIIEVIYVELRMKMRKTKGNCANGERLVDRERELQKIKITGL